MIPIGTTSLPPEPTQTSKRVTENSNLTLHSSIHADIKLYWCFEGTNNYNICCACGDQCSENDWILTNDEDGCACEYNCSLTVNSVSMKYNNGNFISKVIDGHIVMLSITHVTVISSDNSKTIYYITASGAGILILMIIFLIIAITRSIKERYYKKTSSHISYSVDQTTSRKEVVYTIMCMLCTCGWAQLYEWPDDPQGSTVEYTINTVNMQCCT